MCRCADVQMENAFSAFYRIFMLVEAFTRKQRHCHFGRRNSVKTFFKRKEHPNRMPFIAVPTLFINI